MAKDKIMQLGLNKKQLYVKIRSVAKTEIYKQLMDFHVDTRMLEAEFSQAALLLPQEIQTFLTSPLDKQAAPDLKKFATHMATVALSPRNNLLLSPVWKTLADELKTEQLEQDRSPKKLERVLRSLIITDVLLYQSSIPLERKKIIKRVVNDLRTANGDPAPAFGFKEDPKSPSLELPKNAVELQNALSEFSSAPPKNEAEALEKLRFFKTCLDIVRSLPYVSISGFLSPDFQKWISSLPAYPEGIFNLAIKPLLRGELEYLDAEYFRFYIWLNSWRKPSDENNEGLINYFFTHKEIQRCFWEDQARQILPKKQKGEKKDGSLKNTVPDDLMANKLILESPAIAKFYSQDERVLGKFLETAKLEELKPKQADVLRNLIIAAGIFKKNFPNDPKFPFLLGKIKELIAQAGKTGDFSKFLSILNDESPGLLYVAPGFKLRIMLPDKEKSQEECEKSLADNFVIYVSESPWPKKETPKPTADKKEQPSLVEGKLISLETWRETQVLSAEKLETVINCLKKKLNGFCTSGDILFDLLLDYSSHATLEKGDTVLPDLLPKNHPLTNLKALGIIGIEHLDGNVVRFVIAADKIGVETMGPKKLVLDCKLNKDNELKIPNAPEDFSYSSLHLFLNAAALLGKTHDTPYLSPLTKEEITEAHRIQQAWKDLVRNTSLPLLTDPMNNVNGCRLVRVPIGQKIAHFAFVR